MPKPISQLPGLSNSGCYFPNPATVAGFFVDCPAHLDPWSHGKRLFGVTVGPVVATLLAITPLHIYYSQELRFYSLATFAVLAVIYVFILTTEHKTTTVSDNVVHNGAINRVKVYWLQFAVITTISLYSHYYTLLVLVALGLWLPLYSLATFAILAVIYALNMAIVQNEIDATSNHIVHADGNTKSLPKWAIFAAIATISLYSHYYTLLVLVALGLWLLLFRRDVLLLFTRSRLSSALSRIPASGDYRSSVLVMVKCSIMLSRLIVACALVIFS